MWGLLCDSFRRKAEDVAKAQKLRGTVPRLPCLCVFCCVSLKGTCGTQGLTQYVREPPRTPTEEPPDHRKYLWDRIPPGNPTRNLWSLWGLGPEGARAPDLACS